MKVCRLLVEKGLVSKGGNFEVDATGNRKPVEFFKYGCDVMSTFSRRDDDSGKRILDKLKSMNGKCKAVKEGVTVIKARRHKSISKDDGRVGIKTRTNLTELADVIMGCTAYGRDVLFVRKVAIKDHAKVANRGCGVKNVVSERNIAIWKFGSLLWGTYYKIFCFGRI